MRDLLRRLTAAADDADVLAVLYRDAALRLSSAVRHAEELLAKAEAEQPEGEAITIEIGEAKVEITPGKAEVPEVVPIDRAEVRITPGEHVSKYAARRARMSPADLERERSLRRARDERRRAAKQGRQEPPGRAKSTAKVRMARSGQRRLARLRTPGNATTRSTSNRTRMQPIACGRGFRRFSSRWRCRSEFGGAAVRSSLCRARRGIGPRAPRPSRCGRTGHEVGRRPAG